MFLSFVFLFPIILAEKCPPPEVFDQTKTQLRYTPNDEDFYVPGSTIYFQCRNGAFPLNDEQNQGRKCLENGAWSREPVVCGIDVARDYNWTIIAEGGCDSTKNSSCTVRRYLYLMKPENIDGLAIKLTKNLADGEIIVSIKTLSGNVLSCPIQENSEDDLWRYADCSKGSFPNSFIVSSPGAIISEIKVISKEKGIAKPVKDLEIFADSIGLSTIKATFEDAKNICKMSGGHLFQPNTPSDLAFLKNFLEKKAKEIASPTVLRKSSYRQPKWIDLSAINGSWTWGNGELFEEDDNPNQTFDQNAEEGSAVVIYSNDHRWTKAQKSTEQYFLCSIDSLNYSCPYPGSPAGGKIANYEVEGSFVEYRCVNGYKMNGQAIRHCDTSKGTWSGMPSCEKI